MKLPKLLLIVFLLGSFVNSSQAVGPLWQANSKDGQMKSSPVLLKTVQILMASR